MSSLLPAAAERASFVELVWEYYANNARPMPWRQEHSPYKVLVSEIMLQQTQVERVIPRFQAFMTVFPDIDSLANAPLSDVLSKWVGLGYNRRARFLHESARMITDRYDGLLPDTQEALVELPGVGPNTAAAIQAYAFNQPSVFIETNIRTVYLHHFFPDTTELVHDKDLLPIVEATLDKEHPREWYWALMDYGRHLKRTSGGRLSQSAHYKPQSRFLGSKREMRGRIIRELVSGPISDELLRSRVAADERYEPALHALQSDRLIEFTSQLWSLTAMGDTR